MFGWCGKILRIDLTSGDYSVESVEPSVLHENIGGKGLCGYYLNDFITLPYSDPAMPILLFTGPLVDTQSPTSGRMTIMSRSPLSEHIRRLEGNQ